MHAKMTASRRRACYLHIQHPFVYMSNLMSCSISLEVLTAQIEKCTSETLLHQTKQSKSDPKSTQHRTCPKRCACPEKCNSSCGNLSNSLRLSHQRFAALYQTCESVTKCHGWQAKLRCTLFQISKLFFCSNRFMYGDSASGAKG